MTISETDYLGVSGQIPGNLWRNSLHVGHVIKVQVHSKMAVFVD